MKKAEEWKSLSQSHGTLFMDLIDDALKTSTSTDTKDDTWARLVNEYEELLKRDKH